MIAEVDPLTMPAARCRRCGCTDEDCSRCIDLTGESCWWIQPDLCSACVTVAEVADRYWWCGTDG